MKKRSPFPKVFWVANSLEILERFAYYGIYLGFGAYMDFLGYTRDDLGLIQSIFLFVSYFIPVFSGTMADRYGFKKVLIISYIAYIPSILLLLVTNTLSELAITMLSIGFAAGIFKPLVSSTVRLTTDSTNKSMGFGIFYMMVNIGGSFGPIMAGKLGAISWNYAFIMAAASISVMFIITLLFYKEPPREPQHAKVGEKLMEIIGTLADRKFALFLFLLGIFFWLPFWAFYNIVPEYIDKHIDCFKLYHQMHKVIPGFLLHILSRTENGMWRINGVAVGNTGFIILVFQLAVTRIFERRKALIAFIMGLMVVGVAFIILGISIFITPALAILGVVVFAIGEMMSSPRIQEYITWIAPREKAGLYMGSNFLATCLGALLSGFTYTSLFGKFEKMGHPEYIWFALCAHIFIGSLAFFLFIRYAGEFKELQQ